MTLKLLLTFFFVQQHIGLILGVNISLSNVECIKSDSDHDHPLQYSFHDQKFIQIADVTCVHTRYEREA